LVSARSNLIDLTQPTQFTSNIITPERNFAMTARTASACPETSTTGQTTKTDQGPALDRTLKIRALNDHLRRTGKGGIVLVTDGISSSDPDFANAVLLAVTQFDQFGETNDPWGEHDCAGLDVNGCRVIWKIEYYDRQMEFHSPDPANPKVTTRVLTIMLADEY
jgi:hypothetical protein